MLSKQRVGSQVMANAASEQFKEEMDLTLNLLRQKADSEIRCAIAASLGVKKSAFVDSPVNHSSKLFSNQGF